MNIAHTSVECALTDYYAGDWVDRLDELKVNHDERHVIANAGAYVLQFGVVNVGDNDSAFDSALGVDAVLTAAAVPEPSTFVASVIAIAGLCMLRRGSASSARRVAA